MRLCSINWIATTSLVLCVATVAIWMRTLFMKDVVQFYRDGQYCGLETGVGTVALSKAGFTFEWPGESDSNFRYYARRFGREYPHSGLETIIYERGSDWHMAITGCYVFQSGDTVITLPIWPAVVAFAVAPVRAVWRKRRERSRIAKNLCHLCAYDLRASEERCPECGAPICVAPPVNPGAAAEVSGPP
jgi:hypothetical protein